VSSRTTTILLAALTILAFLGLLNFGIEAYSFGQDQEQLKVDVHQSFELQDQDEELLVGIYFSDEEE